MMLRSCFLIWQIISYLHWISDFDNSLKTNQRLQKKLEKKCFVYGRIKYVWLQETDNLDADKNSEERGGIVTCI